MLSFTEIVTEICNKQYFQLHRIKYVGGTEAQKLQGCMWNVEVIAAQLGLSDLDQI